MATEVEPNGVVEKIKWRNRRDEAYGLVCLSISRDLLFHLDVLKSPNEVWEIQISVMLQFQSPLVLILDV